MIFRALAWATIGFVGWKMFHHGGPGNERAAFASGEATGEGFSQVRSAGPEGMRSDPPEWDRTDQAGDESFPASDPPAH